MGQSSPVGVRMSVVTRILVFAFCLAAVVGTAPSVEAQEIDAKWKQAQIDDALKAAPVPVTEGARIFAWQKAQLVLVRDGRGPYTCVASGSWSLRLGKPALPYPDPLCADQNSWAYLQALWSEPNPMHPAKPFPRAPGLVWMLAGMDVVNGKVAYGNNAIVKAGSAEDKTITMTPHVMILPLSVDAQVAALPTAYDPAHGMWVMGAGTPTAHLHVHFSSPTYVALEGLK